MADQETTPLFNVYVIWILDGPCYLTLLQYDDTDQQRQCMTHWSTQDYVQQAWDAENSDTDEPNPIVAGGSYECCAIFEGANIRFIA